MADCAGIGIDATIAITIGEDGVVRRVETPGMDTSTATCVVTAVRAVTFGTRSRDDVVRVALEPSPVAAGSSASTAAAGSDVRVAPSAAENAARARIDEVRAAVLACTSSEAAAVVAEWTADGALLIHLPDARAGTPEDGCVRALFAGAALTPAPGAPGFVLHAVH